MGKLRVVYGAGRAGGPAALHSHLCQSAQPKVSVRKLGEWGEARRGSCSHVLTWFNRNCRSIVQVKLASPLPCGFLSPGQTAVSRKVQEQNVLQGSRLCPAGLGRDPSTVLSLISILRVDPHPAPQAQTL